MAVAERVYSKLENQKIASKYEEVFDIQEELGIIEPVKNRSSGQVFIPHRPVIRNEENVTTKIRPVFNCSLKVGNAPSLNEAAFPGIDLMNNLLSLVMYFRNNNYVILADIVKAFLQVRLSLESDRNKFCFFRKINGKFVAYRYNTIIFGFVSSPFILNYIIKHHLKKFSDDKCNEMLNRCLYVDNLIYTSNDVNQLINLYGESINRMDKGVFNLRSWNSNNKELQEIMKQDEKYVTHI